MKCLHNSDACKKNVVPATAELSEMMQLSHPQSLSYGQYQFEAAAICKSAGTFPHALLICPIMHPVTAQKSIGVLQCFNKRSRDGAFTDADLLTAKLLCRYVAAAAINASHFDSHYRCRLLSRRAAELTSDIVAERDIIELPGMIIARAKEILGSQRARLYFLHSPIRPGSNAIHIDLQPLPNVVCSSQ